LNNLFVSTTFVPDGSPLEKALEYCDSSNIKSVEIGSNHCYEENYGYLSHYNYKYLVHNYFPIPQKSFVLNIASFDEKIRTASIKHIKRAIDLCEKINAKLYTFHPGFLTDPKGSNNTNSNFDFQWDENQLSVSSFTKAKELMYHALDKVVDYAESKKINIAIETEGSLNKKDHLLMQQPFEYEEFKGKYHASDIGINLNIGHLNLAANAFDFNRSEFVDLIQNYIVAMELSHNDGVEDQHLPLQLDSWYWDTIMDPRFDDVYKILEFRNTSISEIAKNIQMIQKKENVV
jgi:sugar phosphate isomerase/epimerase